MNVKKKIFMLKRLTKDFSMKSFPFPVASDLHSQKLKTYYFLFTEDPQKLNPLISKFDKNGIPLNRTYIDVADQKYIYFPISIGQIGLAVYHSFLKTKLEKDKSRFLSFADWFLNNAEIDSELGARWLTDVELPQYKNPGPWQSAFSQSRGISILLRAYQMTGEMKYLDVAEKALLPFNFHVSMGGVSSFTKYGPFFEEYSSSVPTLVLNGKMFSLFGIYDFCRAIPENTLAPKLFEQGINTLINILPEFDLGFWSRYNLCQADWHPDIDPARISYHLLHIEQLKILFRLTSQTKFAEYKNKFEQQFTLKNKIKMYFLKYKSLKQIGRI